MKKYNTILDSNDIDYKSIANYMIDEYCDNYGVDDCVCFLANMVVLVSNGWLTTGT